MTETASNVQVQHAPETRKEWTERLKKKLKPKFDKVDESGKPGKLLPDHVQQDRATIDINPLLELFENNWVMWKQMWSW